MVDFKRLESRFGARRAVKFGLAGIAGFLVLEGVVVVGLYSMYGEAEVPSGAATTPVLLALDVVASVVGVTVGFIVNEKTTAEDVQKAKGAKAWLVRLLKFQGVYVVGNGITIGVQLALLATFGLSPAIGSLIGAVVAYPPSYMISMKYVWKAL